MNILILLCGITLVAGTNYELAKEWNSWKDAHGKRYDTSGEEQKRLSIWLANKRQVDRHNTEAEIHGFTLAMNVFGDLVRHCVRAAQEFVSPLCMFLSI